MLASVILFIIVKLLYKVLYKHMYVVQVQLTEAGGETQQFTPARSVHQQTRVCGIVCALKTLLGHEGHL